MWQKGKAYSREHVIDVVKRIEKCLSTDNFAITTTEKYYFQRRAIRLKYNIYYEELKSILKSLKVENFCYSLVGNTAFDGEEDVPYTFLLCQNLYNADEDEHQYVHIIVSVVLIELADGKDFMAVDFYQTRKYNQISRGYYGGRHDRRESNM